MSQITTKGFVSMSELMLNDYKKISALGELSVQSQTYSKDISTYSSGSFSGYTFTCFDRIDAGLNAPANVPNELVEQIFAVVGACRAYANNHISPYNRTDFLAQVANTFYSIITSVEMGAFVSSQNITLPEWVSWVSPAYGTVKIWLADASFQKQYPDYEICVVPFIANYDLLLSQAYASACSYIKTCSENTEYLAAIAKSRGIYPETALVSYSAQFVNIYNAQQTYKVTWPVLVYGAAGASVDKIREAIIEHILDNSTQPQEIWEKYFPDLFRRTSFYILPRWDKVAIENQGLLAAANSVISMPSETLSKMQAVFDLLPTTHVTSYLEVFYNPYRTTLLQIIPGANNPSDKLQLSQLYLQYLPVSTSQTDFARMPKKVQDWAIVLEQLLMYADKQQDLAEGYRYVSLKVTSKPTKAVVYTFDEVDYYAVCNF